MMPREAEDRAAIPSAVDLEPEAGVVRLDVVEPLDFSAVGKGHSDLIDDEPREAARIELRRSLMARNLGYSETHLRAASSPGKGAS